MIYLDNAATTRIDERVIKAMLPFLKNEYGNPGALNALGRSALHAVNQARKQVSELFHCSPEHIVFTSGGSEGNNTVLRGFRTSDIHKESIVVSEIEHDSILKLAYSGEVGSSFIKTKPFGYYDTDNACYLMQVTNPGLVSIMYVNNETGVVNYPTFPTTITSAHKMGALFHTDCVQAAGSYDLDMNNINCDFATISSHKIHGPKGVGAIYLRDTSTLKPLIYGGDMQEFGLRGGTENVASIVGFGKACEIAMDEFEDNKRHIRAARIAFLDAIQKELSGYSWFVNGASDFNSKVINICIPGFDAQTMVLLLSARGVAASAGSACTSHETHPSHVLKAMGLSDDDAASSLRFSFSKYTTIKEAKMAASILRRAMKTCETLTR